MQTERGDPRRLGDILVAIEAVSQRELERYVRAQIEAVVFELMSWREGHFSFEEGSVRDLAIDASTRISTESLLMEAARRIDEHDRRVAGRRASRHVPGVLHVTGRVGDEHAPLRRREHTPRDVDGDALLPLGGEPVGEQRRVDVPTGRAVHTGVRGERIELVVEHLPGVEQQATDERRLAVVDAPTHQQTQQR
jgi:hypothetical protein